MKFLATLLLLHLLIACVLMLLPEVSELKDYAIKRSEHICQLVNTKQKNWTAHSQWTWNITSALLGQLFQVTAINNPGIMKPIYDKTKKISSLMPNNFSVSDKWPKCADIILKIPKMILSTHDTTICKTSWAVAMASVLTDRLCIFTRGFQRAELSPVDVVQCCKNCSVSERSSVCVKGGDAQSAWLYWIENGIVSGGFTEEGAHSGCQPIVNEDIFVEKCHNTCTIKDTTPDNNARMYKSEKMKYKFGEQAYRIPNSQSHIMQEIYLYGPVQTAFILYEDFLVYRNGIYVHTIGRRIGYHTVKIIGWGEENSVLYWLLVNIWGKKFGENGTVRFLKGSNHLEIEQNAISCTYRRLDPRLQPLAKYSENNDGNVAVSPSIASLPLVLCTHLLYKRNVYC